MKTFKEEIDNLKLFFKYYFKQMNLLKIFTILLLILSLSIGIFIDAPWSIRILIVGLFVVLLVLRKQYLIGDHRNLYRKEMDKKIKIRLTEQEMKGNLNKKIEEELKKDGGTTTFKE